MTVSVYSPYSCFPMSLLNSLSLNRNGAGTLLLIVLVEVILDDVSKKPGVYMIIKKK